MPTNDAALKAFIQKFPWIVQYINPALIMEANVSRVDESLLCYRPIHPKGNADEGTQPDTHIYLVDSEGKSLSHVGFESPAPGPNLRWRTGFLGLFRPKKDVNDTASRALARLGADSDKVAYIVSLDPERGTDLGWYGDRRNVIVYEQPQKYGGRRSTIVYKSL